MAESDAVRYAGGVQQGAWAVIDAPARGAPTSDRSRGLVGVRPDACSRPRGRGVQNGSLELSSVNSSAGRRQARLDWEAERPIGSVSASSVRIDRRI